MPKNNKFLSDQYRKNGFVPKKKEDKRTRVAAWVLIVLIAFCTVCSFLTLGMTVKNCEEANAEEGTAVGFATASLPFSPACTLTYYTGTGGSVGQQRTTSVNIVDTSFTFTFYAGSSFSPVTWTRYISSPDYTNGYEIGYSEGFEAGKTVSDNSAYQNGFNIGKGQGYSQGYNAGLESSNKYTFLNLIASVVDAPIQAVAGLLNFNLLGFNMLNFFYALLTLAIIVAVVRLIL